MSSAPDRANGARTDADGDGDDDGDSDEEPTSFWQVTEFRAAAIAGVLLLAEWICSLAGAPAWVSVPLAAVALSTLTAATSTTARSPLTPARTAVMRTSGSVRLSPATGGGGGSAVAHKPSAVHARVLANRPGSK